MRDSASRELDELLAREQHGDRLGGAPVLLQRPRAQHVRRRPITTPARWRALLGSDAVAGCFCQGELGPVGGRTFVHGFTASVALW